MLNDRQIASRLAALDGWTREGNAIVKTFHFADYHETLAFVNAVAWIAQRSDHHPDLEVGYDRCRVSYTTHSAGGLTDEDFAAAARIDALFFTP
ncbi:MAG: 4a-hydroxytetrahydrobiopterin dehydratase [Rhodocyclaceae bacterium]